MRRGIGALTIGACVLWASYVGAANQVVVDSKTVLAGATGVVIGARVTNDGPEDGYCVPLVIRAVTPGSFITTLSLSWGGRATSYLTDIAINNQYAAQDYNCGLGGLGFGQIVSKAADSSCSVAASPRGVMFVRMAIQSPNLPPGTDTVPSMKMIVNVTTTPGTFEVDTTCTSLGNHLTFVWGNDTTETVLAIRPAFTKGVITIAACNCAHHGDLNGNGVIDIIDWSLLRNYVYNGSPIPVKDPLCPHVDRGDVNCSGYDDTVDLVYLLNYIFNSGPAPCDPCACSPYPTNCP